MNSLMNKFNKIVEKILLLEEDEVTDDVSRKENEEWDSMTHLVLVSEIEEAFNITLSDDNVIEIHTIKDIKEILKKHSVALE